MYQSGVDQGEGGASDPVREVALWIRQGALPRVGKKHATTDVATGDDELDKGGAVLGVDTGSVRQSILIETATSVGWSPPAVCRR